MAKLDFVDLEALSMSFAELASLPTSVLEGMLDAEGEVIMQAQKSTAQAMGVRDTGQIVSSIEKGSKNVISDGVTMDITFGGSRKRHNTTTRNAEIAFINEFGKKGQPARPFIQTANEKYADRAVEAAEEVYDNYLQTLDL